MLPSVVLVSVPCAIVMSLPESRSMVFALPRVLMVLFWVMAPVAARLMLPEVLVVVPPRVMSEPDLTRMLPVALMSPVVDVVLMPPLAIRTSAPRLVAPFRLLVIALETAWTSMRLMAKLMASRVMASLLCYEGATAVARQGKGRDGGFKVVGAKAEAKAGEDQAA